MGKNLKIIGFIIVLVLILVVMIPPSYADECFNASKKLTEDAQTIRLKALKMGWVVGKTTSLTAATIIEGKAKLYPKDDIEVCLKEMEGKLQMKVQSKSGDAGKAEWHKIKTKKKK